MRRCSLSRQLTTNGLVSISNYASRPEARLLLCTVPGRKPTRAFLSPQWPSVARARKGTYFFFLSLYRSLPQPAAGLAKVESMDPH